MARFCEYCGSSLGELQLCTCPKARKDQAAQAAQAAREAEAARAAEAARVAEAARIAEEVRAAEAAARAAEAAARTAAQAAEAEAVDIVSKAEGKNIVMDWLQSLLGCLTNPRAATRELMAKPNVLVMSGTYAAVPVVVMILFALAAIFKVRHTLLSSFDVLDIADMVSFPFGRVLLAGILVPVLCLGASFGGLFGAAKLFKKELTIQQVLAITAVGAIYPSGLMLVAAILGLISLDLMMVVAMLAIVAWVVIACGYLREYIGLDALESWKSMGFVMAAMAIGGLAVLISMVLGNWCVSGIQLVSPLL